MRALTTLTIAAALTPSNPSSRHNQKSPQHRGIESGGEVETRLAKSNKHGGMGEETHAQARLRLGDIQKIESFERLRDSIKSNIKTHEGFVSNLNTDLGTLQEMLDDENFDKKKLSAMLKSYDMEETELLVAIAALQGMRDETKNTLLRKNKKVARLNRTIEERVANFKDDWGMEYTRMRA